MIGRIIDPGARAASCRSRTRRALQAVATLAFCTALTWPAALRAQARGDGPRTYWKKPINTHAITTTLQFTTGNVGFNTELPITGAVIETTVFIASYTVFFGLFGRTNMLSLALPAGSTTGNTTGISPIAIDFAGKGRADPVFFWNVNVIGGPALRPAAFATYRQRTLVDFNLWITAPWGDHDDEDAISLGTDRWMFRLGVPVAQTIGPWSPGRITTLEVFPSVSLFTTAVGETRVEQDPMFNLQVHITRDVVPDLWLSADGIWQEGGGTTEDGVDQDNAQSAISLGLTIGYQITPAFRLTSSWGNSLNDDEDGMNTNTITFMLSYGWNPTAMAAAAANGNDRTRSR